MCQSERSRVLAFLQPPNGPALKLKVGDTWIGRGTFDLSLKAQRLCSRRQACIHFDHFSISIECQGINPLHFVICQSQKFQSCLEADTAEFYSLPKGEIIQLKHGDKFFLANSECLITVFICPLVSNNLASVAHLRSNLHPLVPVERKNEADSFQTTTVSEEGIDLNGKAGELLPVEADVNCRVVDCWWNEKINEEKLTDQEIDKMLMEEVVEVVDVESKVSEDCTRSCISTRNLLSFHQCKPFSNVNVVPKRWTKSVTRSITQISLGEKLAAEVNYSEVSSVIPEESGAVMTRARDREQVFLNTYPQSFSKIRENEDGMETFCESKLDNHQPKKEANSIMGDESVIATVSGYPLAERDKLVRLILQTGSYYIGGLSKDKPITHVVCWRFSGKKYELAKKWGKVIVNHRWFEDCLKAGKRLNEKSYTLASGEFVGHVKWEEKGGCYLMQGKRWLSSLGTVSAPQVIPEEIVKDRPKAAVACEQNHEITENLAYQPGESFEELSRVSVTCEDIHRNSPPKASARLHELKHVKANENPQPENCVITTEEKRPMGAWSNHYDENIKSGCQEQTLQLGCHRQLEKELLRKPILPMKVNAFNWPSSSKGNKRTNASPIKGLYEQLLLKRGKRQVQTKFEIPRSKSPSGKCKLEYHPSNSSWESTPSNRENSKSNDQQNSDSCLALEEERLDHLSVECCVAPTPAAEVSCVICQDEIDCFEEGLLTCGHKFCFSCIRRWAYKAQCKAPNCPLCKAPFDFIIKREVLEKSNDKGDTFITASKEISETVIMVKKQDGVPNLLEFQELSCIFCQSRDTEDLLLVCNGCQERAAHTFCLDPPWPAASGGPWFCARCIQSFR